MANWTGAARSNYVHITDMGGLLKSLESLPISIHSGKDGTCCFSSEELDSGGWPSFYIDADDSGEDHETEFTFETHIMPYVQEGDVLVAMEVGNEKLRYLTGFATAFCRRGSEVETVSVNLDDIYTKANSAFGVQPTTAKY